jgi:uncharacterized membrane-anchored protein
MDHGERRLLAGEAHARPTAPVPARSLVLHAALRHADGGAAARAFANALCERAGVPPPPRDVDHAVFMLDGDLLKWERHGEFTTWTLVRPGAQDAAAPILEPPPFEDAPGERFVAAAAFVSPDKPTDALLDAVLGPESPENERAAALISDSLCGIWTGFRIGDDGWTRFLVQDAGLGPFRAGRVVRRLLEIETYRIAALFAFPLAKEARHELDTLEAQVGAAIADEAAGEADTLDALTFSARRIEAIAQRTAFRFAAAAAYRTLVGQRLKEFREERIPGYQRLSAFLDRRFQPAMDTCAATAARIETLAKRVERASGLLRTRIDLQRQAQNQRLLESMNENARTQIRLQKAVEGFSVAAISYYAYMLLAKVLAPVLDAAGLRDSHAVQAGLVVGVIATVWLVLWALRRRLDRPD